MRGYRIFSSNFFAAPKLRLGGLVTAVLLVAFSTGWLSPAAPLEGPGKNDRQVTLIVKALMKREHLSRHPLDDEISGRAMKIFTEGFDARKLYFLQSDIDEFMQHRDEIDDFIDKADSSFAYKVFDRFITRLDQRVETVEQLVKQPFDFDNDESIVTDAKLLTYPKTDEEAKARWRKLIKYNLLTFKSDKIEDQEAREKILRRYKSLQRRWHQSDSDELLERYLSAVTTSYDPHTTYMSPSTLENFRILMRLNLEGIGAALQVSEEGTTKITKIIPGGAADKHGKLKPEDNVVSVGEGASGEMVDVVDMKLNDVVQLIRGPAGSIVRLGIAPAGGGESKIYSITRAKIELADSAARSEIIKRGAKPDGTSIKLGVIDLPSFYMDMEAARESNRDGSFRSTTRDVRQILKKFNEEKVDAVVLDLRRNGGGSLTEAINLTGLFIDEGPVVQVKDSGGRIQAYNDLERGMAWDGPLVVLTSKFSASASEILAGAIQDYQRGLIVGDAATHGKGTVQSLLDLSDQLFRIANRPNLGALKITMQQFYRPNGDSTQKRGVIPDVTLPSLTTHIGMGEADLDHALDFDRIQPGRFTSHNMVNADAVLRMKANSSKRIQKSDEFVKQIQRIERYKKYKDEKSISLNEKEFLARRESDRDAEKEEEKQFDESSEKDDKVFSDDFYNKEVTAITLDYLRELADNRVAQAN
ncbi:MAG: carboxy terminal-processing peptidase [Pirellulaceae bacterium]|jgi:carboxyl-terminal processing protease|nr:tail-specific protease [Planctomycetaceae bacterium]MDP6554340.1 carboxy terminal-processing peptidase [Pirellulaceae bacterium]